MPRDIPVGNGCLLINFDNQYQLRDLYYPYVGKENHTAGHPFHFGIWADGDFRWVHDAGWERELQYEPDTLVTRVRLRHPDLGLTLECCDTVDFHENLYLRRVTLHNEWGRERQVRLFFHHDFHISETEVGDTAYYEPERRAVLHYKADRWFMINGRPAGAEKEGINSWATGTKEIHGQEGTFRDAEDGELGRNPIAQGSVDSTIALHQTVPAGGEATTYYWMAVGKTFEDVTRINRRVRQRGPEFYIDRTEAYWRLWTNKEMTDFHGLPERIVDLYKRSLLIVRTQIDNHGAIIAANDYDITRFARDTYSYMWPRDGALVAHALDMAGYSAVTQQFYNFCADVITKEGYFLHKYNPDGSLASSWHPWYANGEKQLPIQEDETGLVIWALWHHFDRFRDIEFIKPLYRRLIIAAAEFMVDFRLENGLPKPSHDLWEERWGIHAFTVAATYAGLMAAHNFAAAFGEDRLADRYQTAAQEIRAATDEYLWSDKAGRFVRMINFREDGSVDIDWTMESSMYGLFYFGMYPPDHPRIVATMQAIYDRLWVKTDVGGMARYENDYYHQVSQDIEGVPGNPWFICTLWQAQWHVARAQGADELAPALDLLNWVADRALVSGVLAEQVNPYTNEPLSVSPLTWSHATVVATVLEYLDRLSEMSVCEVCSHPTYMREAPKLRHVHQHHEARKGSQPE
jgi:GH15 family glucan-1,4-alpha-glucosidase